MPDRDEETGRYTGEYSTEDFLNAISAEDGLAGTGDIADRVGCAHDTAYKRLQRLEKKGLVSSRKVGNTLLWTSTKIDNG
ncbi:transcriptional regulator [Salinibaculum rarum]|uniref:transcriptional regulator n=1 Tax=Salinibaculum rarum TaxID=3058903 RepID=UPI00265FB61A|nr:transcriptional regulator [Salinibaculum sp. KK48]